jgi:Uma2 family endonuclease
MSTAWFPPLAEAPPRGRELTFDQWVALPEDEPGELVDGRLEDEEVADPVHELTVTWLVALLRSWLGGSGFLFGSELKLRLHEHKGRKPDLSLFFPGRAPPPRQGAVAVPPDIVVEVVSPSPRDERRDRVDKMDDYAAFGVRYYWVLDPALGSFEIFGLDAAGRYTRLLGRTAGKVESVPGCEGLIVDLDDLWMELSRLSPD